MPCLNRRKYVVMKLIEVNFNLPILLGSKLYLIYFFGNNYAKNISPECFFPEFSDLPTIFPDYIYFTLYL